MKFLDVIVCLVLICSNSNGQFLDDSPYGLAGRNQEISNMSVSHDVGDDVLPHVLEDSNNDVAERAKQALTTDIIDPKYDVSDVCLNHTKLFLGGLVSRKQWALRMIDAMGKPHSELLNGHITWLGSYDECIAIKANVNMSGLATSPFIGRYCTATFPLGQAFQKLVPLLTTFGAKLKIGVCVPNSCSERDTKALLNTLLSILPINASKLPEPDVSCQKEELQYDAKAIIALTICALFGTVMIAATAYDVIVIQWLSKRRKVTPNKEFITGASYTPSVDEKTTQLETFGGQKFENGVSDKVPMTEIDLNDSAKQVNGISTGDVAQKKDMSIVSEERYTPGTLGKVLLSFSIYTNTSKILNTNQPAGTLSAVNGIRFISMTWVILGHNFAFPLPAAENFTTLGFALLKRFTFEAIKNALVSVDTFFVLSGLLVSYLSLKEMKKRGGIRKFQWGMFYFHRFWRLTPPYMLFMMFYVCLSAYWYNGPNWAQQGINTDVCGKYWWRNLLYINNLFPASKMCMAWSWYLANDMQFYILSPLMLIPLYKNAVFGVLSCAALLIVNLVSAYLISSDNSLGPSVVFDRSGKSFDDYYDKPYCRIGPYVVGFFAGYLLYRTECKLRIPKIVNLFGWLVATTLALLVLYGTYDKSGVPTLSGTEAATYNATNRIAWGVAIAWVVVACATGHGGFVNTLLSWKALIPLSRLTYCAYLVHPVVMFVYIQGRRTLMYLTDIEAVYLFCGNLCISYVVAFIVSLTFESPMMGLEKALLGRKKNS